MQEQTKQGAQPLNWAAFAGLQAELPVKDIEVPEWGVTVRIRTLTAWEREQWERGAEASIAGGTFYAGLIALCVVDGAGERVFVTDDQIAVLNRKAGNVVKRLYDECIAHNGIGRAAGEAAKKP